jgi:hypothetical protein
MNERINELLLEAHRQTKGGIYSGHLSDWTEKFAELIVRECIDAVSDCSVEYCTRPQIVSEIKEHFGVGS